MPHPPPPASQATARGVDAGWNAKKGETRGGPGGDNNNGKDGSSEEGGGGLFYLWICILYIVVSLV